MNVNMPTMRSLLARCAFSIAMGSGLAATAPAHAASVTFVAVDLADVTPGEDLWQYGYVIRGPLDPFYAVNLLFSPTDYRGLTLDEVSDPGSIDVVLTEPDPGLPADGQGTATALLALSGTDTAGLKISFIWTGAGTPGSQTFQVLDDLFNVVQIGVTTPPAPPGVDAPPTAFLALAALGAMLFRRRVRNNE